jgi:hypothetical protein
MGAQALNTDRVTTRSTRAAGESLCIQVAARAFTFGWCRLLGLAELKARTKTFAMVSGLAPSSIPPGSVAAEALSLCGVRVGGRALGGEVEVCRD